MTNFEKPLFPYEWKLFEIKKVAVPYHGKTVFSCFAGGGGSSMGYKLAGYDVIGCNEIDDKMFECYEKNLKPKIFFKEDIRNLLKKELPKKLFNLDVLDGSPPCSLFSVVNMTRKKYRGKEKTFREGQKKQILDTLFFDFIQLAKRLQPKIIVAENVMGMIKKDTIKYVQNIIKDFIRSGYFVNIYKINTEKMGLPQKRQRLIFIAIRKDLMNKKIKTIGIVHKKPVIDFSFKEKIIPFKTIHEKAKKLKEIKVKIRRPVFLQKNWDFIKQGQSFSDVHPKKSFFNSCKLSLNLPVPPLTTFEWIYSHPTENRSLNVREYQLCSSFPLDYNFMKLSPYYAMGMSVPPIIMAQIAWGIKKQWLDKINSRRKIKNVIR